MKLVLVVFFIFAANIGYSQLDTTYLPGKHLVVNFLNKNKLSISISKWQETKGIKIKLFMYMIPYQVYVENKKLIESKISVNKFEIRKVKKSEIIKTQ